MIKQILRKVGILSALIALGVFGIKTAYAASTPQFNQTVNAGTLSVDVVDDSFVTVASPAVDMEDVAFNFACQTATGILGTDTERIYVQNPDAADGGWDVSLAASSTTAVWDGVTDYDFNDPGTGNGCTDKADGDTDSLAGQMTVDPSVADLTVGQCASCDTEDISAGSSAAFNEGTINSITILTGVADSDDIGDWTLEGVSISQKVPAEQAADDTYHIHMVLSILAKS